MADIKSIYGNPICDAKARSELADKADKTEVDEISTRLSNTKVDKVQGKGLSENDYTDEEKEKLSGIEENANNYVLPSDVVHDNEYVHTDNNYTDGEKEQVKNISSNISNAVNDVNSNIQNKLLGKVDKVSGKGLSSNDYTDEDKKWVKTIAPMSTVIDVIREGKVDKIEGKGLSENDYTTEEKNKLAELNNYDDTNIKTDIAKKADKLKAFPQKTLSGNPIAITDALADEQPLKMCVYGDGIGDLNNGKYEIPIKITGKNMFDISKITKFVAGNYSTNMNGYFTKTDNIITSNIGLYGNSAYWYDSKIKFPPGTYTISADFMADKDSGNKNVVLGYKNLSDSSYKNKTFTVSNYRTWERFSYTFEVSTESDIVPLIQAMGVKGDYTNLNIKIKNVQIEQGDTATEYEPYLEHTAAAILDTPLSDSEYIDLASKKRNGETDITVNGNITLFDGVNNITCQTEVSPSKLEVSYYQDINKVLEELRNAILSQGGNV